MVGSHLWTQCSTEDEGLLALRDRPMGGGSKPPHAALAEDRRRERCGKGARDASGGGEGDDHCLRVENIEMTSEPGYSIGSGRSLAGAHVLARRCPAQRWHEPLCGFRRERGKANADTDPSRVGGREGELRAAETVRS